MPSNGDSCWENASLLAATRHFLGGLAFDRSWWWRIRWENHEKVNLWEKAKVKLKWWDGVISQEYKVNFHQNDEWHCNMHSSRKLRLFREVLRFYEL